MVLLMEETLLYVINTLVHNALSLILGIGIAAGIAVYVDPEKFKAALLKRANVSIFGSVLFGAVTPFCACGTMAVIVAMMATALPWGPVMAFLTSSPLMSPDVFVIISGILGFKFALALTISSILIGIGSGYMTHIIDAKTTFLVGQIRFTQTQKTEVPPDRSRAAEAVICCSKTADLQSIAVIPNSANNCCATAPYIDAVAGSLPFWEKYKLNQVFTVIIEIGLKRVIVNFVLFAAVAYLINHFVPSETIVRFLGKGNMFAIPLAALIGLPLYVSSASSLPLIDMLIQNGASGGAMLAFMITGPGTSAGVIAGVATIMKRKAILLYVAFLMVGSIILGYLYDMVLALT